MALYGPARKFLFVHVYRTGGNTMRAMIKTPASFEVGSPHALPEDVQRFMSPECWGGCFRFTVVRHPYTWLLSTWNFTRLNAGHSEHTEAARGFRTWLSWVADVGLTRGHGFLRDRHARQSEFANGMDEVYRFESHPEPILDVCERIGAPKPREVPRLKSREYDGDPAKLLNAEAKSFIQREWAEDFERFGYDG